MKIAIVAPTVLREMPYFYVYKEILDAEKIEYDVINWNRFEEAEEYDGQIYSFKTYMSNSASKLVKAKNHILFQRFVKKKLISGKYDKLIILCPQTVFTIIPFIVKRYKKKYIVDIRDYTVILKLRKLFKILLKNADIRVISSKGYKSWLPNEYEYTIAHNINLNLIKENCLEGLKFNNIIGTVGAIRDYDGNRRIIDNFKNSKYTISFYGTGKDEEKLKEYCKINNVENVIFHGLYKPYMEKKIYSEVSWINAYTENVDNIGYVTALPNRLYNSAIYCRPIIVRKDTYLAQIVNRYNLGIVVDLEEDNLIEQFESKRIEVEKNINSNSKIFLNRVKLEQEIYINEIKGFLNSSKVTLVKDNQYEMK